MIVQILIVGCIVLDMQRIKEVISPSFLLITKNLIGLIDGLQLFFTFRIVGIPVRVVFYGKMTIRFFNILW
jgi:hypothetical protein